MNGVQGPSRLLNHSRFPNGRAHGFAAPLRVALGLWPKCPQGTRFPSRLAGVWGRLPVAQSSRRALTAPTARFAPRLRVALSALRPSAYRARALLQCLRSLCLRLRHPRGACIFMQVCEKLIAVTRGKSGPCPHPGCGVGRLFFTAHSASIRMNLRSFLPRLPRSTAAVLDPVHRAERRAFLFTKPPQ